MLFIGQKAPSIGVALFWHIEIAFLAYWARRKQRITGCSKPHQPVSTDWGRAGGHRGRQSQRPSVTEAVGHGGRRSRRAALLPSSCPSALARGRRSKLVSAFLVELPWQAGPPPHTPKIRAGWKLRPATVLVKTQPLTGDHLACSLCIVTTADPPLT